VTRRARGYAPLDWSADNAALLSHILGIAQAAGPGHAAVFDLDGCLFDTRPRQVQIFRELASQAGFDALYRVEVVHFHDWSLRATLIRAGVDAGWVDAHLPRIRAYWESRFFQSDHVLYDHAMPGAAALVRAVHAAGVHVVYLTGRDDSMRPGTEIALRRFGFPYDDPRATLLTKPDAAQDDTSFKDAALEVVATLGHVVLYLDNEPANVNMFRRRHPDARVVFVETDHSFRPDLPDGDIPWLRSFVTRPV
jgi:beta-phosphoglucomutase-like phosphatase (HAD superfamily)